MEIVTSTTNVKEPTSLFDRFTLKGKKAIVTGAAGGIGRATAMAFAELGADVAIVDIPDKLKQSQEIAKSIAERFGVDTMALGTDVSKKDSVDLMVEAVVKEFGTIDVVHANAGISDATDGPNMDLDRWNRLLSINLTGIMLVDTACARTMKAHGHGGSIINTASICGHYVMENYESDVAAIVCYPVSKAGVLQLTKTLARNYVKDGIRVNSVSPGTIWSGIHAGHTMEHCKFEESKIPAGHFGNLEDITGAVALLATDLGSYMIGTDIVVDGGAIL